MAVRRSFAADDKLALARTEEAIQFSRTLLREKCASTFLGEQHYPFIKSMNVVAPRTPERYHLSSVGKVEDTAGMVPLPDAPARILLVEDEFYIRMDVANALRQVGFEVVEAGCADEAATFLRVNKGVDLVFTDINVPGELNGLSLAAKIRSEFPMMPVLIGSGEIERESEAGRLGKFVAKPYDLRRLVQLVADILGSSLK